MTLIGSKIFTKPWLLICEGAGDHRFFDHIISEYDINNLEVTHPTIEGSDYGGRENFGVYINTISVAESFIKNVKSILIVSDKDSDALESFVVIQKQLERTMLPVPKVPSLLTDAEAGLQSVAVLMVPIDQETGNLESMCLPAAYAKWGLEAATDRFIEDTPSRDWSLGKQAKVRLQAILSSVNKKQPDTGFAAHWSKREEYRIPITHDCFSTLVEHLRAFANMR